MADDRSVTSGLTALIASVAPVDRSVAADAAAHHGRLTKPPGSLGGLEALGIRLATIAGRAIPPLPEPAVVAIFAADHGVHAEGVSPWPQEVTGQMVANICNGGAAVNAISAASEVEVVVVNAGVATDLEPHPRLRDTPVRRGSANLVGEPAMRPSDAERAVLLGAEVAGELIAGGARCLLTGDMGIANTTPSAAVIAALTGADPVAVTGRGTGIDDETLERKIAVVAAGLRRAGLHPDGHGAATCPGRRAGPVDPLVVLAEVGGLEIGAIAGLCLGGAAAGIPVVVDGVITLAGAMVAAALAPATIGFMIASHRSVEPAASAALDHLELDPLIDLGLRLGEGSGAALAYPMVRAAARIMAEMATFDDGGVADSDASSGL